MSSFGYLQIFVAQRDVKGKFQALVNITVIVSHSLAVYMPPAALIGPLTSQYDSQISE